MIKGKIAGLTFICLFVVAVFGVFKAKTAPFKPAAPLPGYLQTVSRNAKAPAIPVIVPVRNRQQEPDSESISINNLFFYNGDARVDLSRLERSNAQKYLGRPRRVKKGYSEMDDEKMETLIYAGGELIFVDKQPGYFLEIKGHGWSFRIKEKNGKVVRFSPGDGLAQLKKAFPINYRHQINNTYVRIGIKTPSGTWSDSALIFEVNKSKNTLIGMSME